jgi:hypothetical protein
MVIQHSNKLLEQLTELEEKIKLIEKLMEDYQLNCDKEELLKAILAHRN